MQISVDKRDGIACVAIDGPIILGESARQLNETMTNLLAEEGRGVIIDMTNINYVDSTGLGELVGTMQRFNEKGRVMALVKPHKRVMSLLELTGLDREFRVYDSIDDAVTTLTLD